MSGRDVPFPLSQLIGAAWLALGGLVRLAHDRITRRNR